jgi:hypothetical protein
VAFVRFVVARRDDKSGVAQGALQAAYELAENRVVDPGDRAAVRDLLQWFSDNLDTPTRFTASRSKGHNRGTSRGISWFKDSAAEHIARMYALKGILDRHGYAVTMITATRIGYATFEDPVQVVAEPFADTRTR